MEHPIRITLDTLARCGGEYALGLQRGAVELHSRDLAEALRSAAASPLAWSGDINWTLVLYDVNGKERIRIGLNESGKNG